MHCDGIFYVIFSAVECISPPPPENGTVLTVYSTSYQLLAVFMCDEDFTAVRETVLSCVDGKRDIKAPVCACKHELYNINHT